MGPCVKVLFLPLQMLLQKVVSTLVLSAPIQKSTFPSLLQKLGVKKLLVSCCQQQKLAASHIKPAFRVLIQL